MIFRYLILVALCLAALFAQVAHATTFSVDAVCTVLTGQTSAASACSAGAAARVACANAADPAGARSLTSSTLTGMSCAVRWSCVTPNGVAVADCGTASLPVSEEVPLVCVPPQILNATGTACVSPNSCQWAKDMQVAGGSFMIETGKNFCHSGCTFALAPDAGSSDFRAKQDGKWYEQRWQGDFKGTGGGASNCGVGDSEEEPAIDPPEEKPDVPDQPCPPGQTAGAQIIAPGGGGGYVCGLPDESQSTDKKQVETTNPDGSTTITDTEKTTVCGVNSCNTTTTTSVTSGGTTQTTTEQTTEQKDAFCKAKPSDKNCTGSGGSGTGTAAGDQSSPDHPKLWERKYPDGLAGVWSAKKTALLNTDIGKLAPSLMPNNIPQNAALPVWNLPLDFGLGMNYGSHNVAPTAEIWGWAKIFLIISALLLARALIFGG